MYNHQITEETYIYIYIYIQKKINHIYIKERKKEIIPSIFSDHGAVRLAVDYIKKKKRKKRKNSKNSNRCRLNNTLVYEPPS